MQFSPLIDRLAGRGADSWNVHREAARRRAAGVDVIILTIGDPDQAPPEPVITATIAALRRHHTGYAPILGHPDVRAAIAARTARRTGRPCSTDNVVVVPGAQAGLYCALQCLVGAGDEVVVPEPVYNTYPDVIAAAGARMVSVPLRPECGFHPDLDAIARAVGPKTRVLCLNSPHNPTGAVFTAAEIAALARICRERDLWLLSDEVYEDLAFARPHTSAWSLAEAEGRAVVVSSLSKSHAMPGFRFGWIVGPPELAQPLFNLLLAMLYGGPPFIQDGALAALSADLPEAAALREAYRARATLLSGLLAAAPGCRALAPEGGMFVLLDVRDTGLGAQEFARGLLEQENVAVLPCDTFGASAAGHLRIALCAPDPRLAEAGERILRFARSLSRM
ncbi:MAG TPA: pyridoxal phosphate-dependent aminotransferase [Stellaceae bacterium]|nr:pyridoxal phosphate-dependent aminotransferase [Stellaceae bacterium]